MKKWVFNIHSYLALLAMIPLLLMVLTGSLLVFKAELDQLIIAGKATVDAEGQERQPLNHLLALVNAGTPDYEIGSWEFFDDGREADRVYLIKRGTDQWFKLYLDPYSGSLLSEPQSLNSDLTDWLLELHYTLLLNDVFTGKPLLGLLVGLLVGIILCVLGVTGLIFYRHFWRNFFRLQWDKRPVIMTRRLHRFSGIWCSPILFVVGLSGVYFNTVEYLEEAEEHAQAPYLLEQRLYDDKLDFDALFADSRRRIDGFVPTYLLMPYEPGVQITFFGRVPGANPFASNYASTVSYHPQTGEHQANYDIRQQSLLWSFLDSLRSLHFGNFAGLPSKLLWCLTGLGLTFLGGSGAYMWFQRRVSKPRRRRSRERVKLAV